MKEACLVAGEAFQDDPLTTFTYPDEKERKRKLQYGFYSLYKYCIKHGLAYATSEKLEGISVWLPPSKLFPSMWAMMRHGGLYTMRKVGIKIKAMKKMMTVLNYEEERHKDLVPYDHWYLQNIAVHPNEQGKGYGGLLIKTVLKHIERDGLPTYLETNTEKNVSIYQRYDFEILEHSIIPETDVPLWCMLRKPTT